LLDTLKLIDELISVVKDQFTDVTKSERTKYKYTNMFAESLTNLINRRTAVLKDISTVNEKTMLNSMKLRTELRLVAEEVKGVNDLDPRELHDRLSNMFEIG